MLIPSLDDEIGYRNGQHEARIAVFVDSLLRSPGQDTVDIAVPCARPGGRRAVIPPGGLGDEGPLHLLTALQQPGPVLRRRHRAIVEEKLLDPVSEQDSVVGVVLPQEHAEDTARAVPSRAPRRHHAGAVAGAAGEAVGIIEDELETAAGPHRPNAAILVFRIAKHEHQHVIDVMPHIEVRADRLEISTQRFNSCPG